MLEYAIALIAAGQDYLRSVLRGYRASIAWARVIIHIVL